MTTLTLAAGQISQIIEIGKGTRVTSSGNGTIEFYPGALADAKNGGTFQTWPNGSNAGSVDAIRGMCIRATATGAMTVTLEEGRNDSAADGAYWDAEYAENTRLPAGLDWLTDTISGFDIYEQGFVKRPTIFFDPSATSSLNRGTYANPYNTATALQTVVQGNMAGQVLGIKRGTTWRTNGAKDGAGWLLQAYGTAAEPFWVVPYGDAEALPIITGGRLTGPGTSYEWTVHSGNVWKCTVDTNVDVWFNGTRLSKKAAAVNVTAAGMSSWVTNVLYAWFPGDASPNSGAEIEINYAENTIEYQAPDVATTGYVNFVGLDVRMASSSPLRVQPNQSSQATIGASGFGPVNCYGCNFTQAGYDAASYSAGFTGSAVTYAGVHGTKRIQAPEFIGNKVDDAINNGVEFSFVDNALVEHNQVGNVGGCNIAELFTDCSGFTLRYNYGDTTNNYGKLNVSGTFTGSGFAAKGVWISGFTAATFGATPAFDATNAKNVNNTIHDNLILDVEKAFFFIEGGSGHAVYNNTCIADHDTIFTDGSNSSLPSGLNVKNSTGANYPADGFVAFNNNIMYWMYSPLCKVSPGWLNPSYLQTGTTGVPSGDNNFYASETASGTANWNVPAIAGGAPSSTASYTTYKSRMATVLPGGAATDANSFCLYGTAHPVATGTYGNSGGTHKLDADAGAGTAIKFSYTTYKPTTSSPLLDTGTTIATRRRDIDGKPVNNTTNSTVGCYEI